jgi:hypothetical protein
MTITPIEQPDPKAVHQRAMRKQIILPVILVVVGLTALLFLTLIPLTPRGLSLVADLLLVIMCLIPMVICLLPVYLMLIAAVALMNRMGGGTTKQVRRVRGATETLAQQTRSTSDTINRKTVNMSARIAPLDRLWSIFDRPDKTE